MRNQGLSLNTGLNSFLQGFETGERIKARKDEKEWTGEQRQRQRQDWKRADTDQVKVDALNQLGGMYEAAQGGLDVDPAEFESVTQKLSTAGIQLPKYGNPKMREWIQSGQQALKTGRLDEPTLELLNWRFAEDVAKGVGNVFEADTQVTQDLKLPKGSKIVGKRIARMDMAPDKSGLAAGLEVTVQTPDGKQVTYLAPATENRTSNDDDPVKIIPLDQMMDTLKGDQLLYRGIQQSPAAIRSMIARLGGSLPEAAKPEIKTFQQGDEIVTAAIGPDGQVINELGRGTLGSIRAAEIGAAQRRDAAALRQKGEGTTASRGGATQQLINYLGESLHGDEKDPKKRARLALSEFEKLQSAMKSSKDPEDAVRSVANVLLRRDVPGEFPGEKQPEFTVKEAFDLAREMVGSQENPAVSADDEDQLLQYLMR